MNCRADLFPRSPKLAKADVLLYVGENKYTGATHVLMQDLLNKWPMPRKTLVHEGGEPGRQAGAMKAMHVAASR
eukprot:1303843-Pyramimonas_sp.AAC.1